MEPIDSMSKVSIRANTLGKYHMVITFLETKGNYQDGMTEADFKKNCLAFLGCVKYPPCFPDYLSEVYKFHVSGVDADTVYNKTDGRAFANLVNGLLERKKPGMTEIEFENHLIEGYPAGGGNLLKKPWWVNWIRKVIDLIDDNWL